jgi:hypothetical protein
MGREALNHEGKQRVNFSDRLRRLALYKLYGTEARLVRNFWCLGSFPKSLEYQSVTKIHR